MSTVTNSKHGAHTIRWRAVHYHRLKWALAIGLMATCFAAAVTNPLSARPTLSGDRVALQLLALIKAKDFAKASTMFHYPQTQSATAREADRASVADWLRALTVEVGDLESFGVQTSGQLENVITLSIAGGDVPYWSSRSPLETQAHRFNAVFRKQRDARLIVHIMNTNGKHEIQSFHFGVASTRPDAQAFMTALARKLL